MIDAQNYSPAPEGHLFADISMRMNELGILPHFFDQKRSDLFMKEGWILWVKHDGDISTGALINPKDRTQLA